MGVRAAFIGCGLIAEEHLKALERIEGITPIAYCDRDESRAAALLHRYGGAYATADVDRVLADDAVDAVYICTHHDTHTPLTERSCEAGKHVMLEKPMALTLDDCRRIGEAVDRSGVTLMTAFKLRYYPMVERARAFIHEPLVSIAQVMDARWPDDFWAQHPVTGGGNVLSQGCHAMDLLYAFNGSEPVRVHAEGGTFTHADTPVIDTMVATIRFANGRVASVALGDCGQTPYVSKFSIQLLDGVRSVHLCDRLKSGVFFDGEKAETITDVEEEGMIRENQAFADALASGTAPPTTYRDGLRATLMILKAFDAIRTGEPQEIIL